MSASQRAKAMVGEPHSLLGVQLKAAARAVGLLRRLKGCLVIGPRICEHRSRGAYRIRVLVTVSAKDPIDTNECKRDASSAAKL